MNTCLKLLLCLLIGFSPLTWAANSISQIEPWFSEKSYQRGDLTEYQKTAYIALLPSKNIKPQKISILWRPVALNSTAAPKPGKIYLLGAVVMEGKNKYIAKELSIFQNNTDLQNSKKWVAYNGTPSAPDTPIDDPIQQLLGEDKNNNGVRDDFEDLILNSELSEPAKQHALQAGKVYGQALTLHISGEALSQAQAHQAMQNLIYAEKCRRQYAKTDDISWQESDYYNDIDRLEASFMSDFYIDDIAGEEQPYDFPKNSCQFLTNVVGVIK
ncbi:MAG: hypothetical protein WAO12_07180 [Venatoribacter sp.]